MSLRIAKRLVGDVTIVDLAGRITLGEGSDSFRATILDLLRTGRRKLLINLVEVSYIDSSGIWVLTAGVLDVKNKCGEFKLLNLTKRVRDLLQITKLFTILEVFDDEATALRSFGEEPYYCRCPVCGLPSQPPVFEGEPWRPQTCPSCSSRIIVMVGEANTDVSITSLEVRGYENEYWVSDMGRRTPFRSWAG
jgi:anti-sigma B factor antagonist